MTEFVITKEWVDVNESPAGGWNKKQLASIGVDWPPISGWKRQVIGKKITEENKSLFENGKTI